MYLGFFTLNFGHNYNIDSSDEINGSGSSFLGSPNGSNLGTQIGSKIFDPDLRVSLKSIVSRYGNPQAGLDPALAVLHAAPEGGPKDHLTMEQNCSRFPHGGTPSYHSFFGVIFSITNQPSNYSGT